MRVRNYHTATTRLVVDDLTDGYGGVAFGPVKDPPDDDADPYRISQEMPEAVGEALVANFDSIVPHTTDSTDTSDTNA